MGSPIARFHRLALLSLVAAVLALLAFVLLYRPASEPPEPGVDDVFDYEDVGELTALEPLAFPTGQPRRIDFHTHLHPAALPRALAIFDEHQVGMAVNLSPVPAGPVLDLLLRMGPASGGRVVTFAGPNWNLLAADHPGERMADDLEAAVRQGARGLKISKALGLGVPRSLDPADGGALLPIDDPLLAPLFERAADLGVPVAIHVGDPVAFWQPLTKENERYDELSLHPEWSYFEKPVPSHRELFEQAKRLYAAHPRTRFVAVHVAGFPEDLGEVARLLDAHPNVSVDIAARVPEIGRHDPEQVRRFFLRYQDRVLFGTDLGVTRTSLMLGAPLAWPEREEDVGRFFSSTWRFLETAERGFEHPTPIQGNWKISGVALPAGVLEKLYFENAARLLRVER